MSSYTADESATGTRTRTRAQLRTARAQLRPPPVILDAVAVPPVEVEIGVETAQSRVAVVDDRREELHEVRLNGDRVIDTAPGVHRSAYLVLVIEGLQLVLELQHVGLREGHDPVGLGLLAPVVDAPGVLLLEGADL